MKVFGIVCLCVLCFVGLFIFGKTMFFADKVADNVLGNAISNYEEYQEIFNTCKQINNDLGVIKSVPDDDKMFAQISKNAMMAAKRQQMNRWVEEYNAKSRMWNRNLWKSNSLPYELSVNQFSNY